MSGEKLRISSLDGTAFIEHTNGSPHETFRGHLSGSEQVVGRSWKLMVISSRGLISALRTEFAANPVFQRFNSYKGQMHGPCTSRGRGVHMEGDFNILNKSTEYAIRTIGENEISVSNKPDQCQTK